MKIRNMFLLGLCLVGSSLNAQIPSYNWAFPMGSSVDDYLIDLITDPAGNVYWTGHVGEAVDVDPGPGTTMVGLGGVRTCILAKYTPEGEFVWEQHWPGAGYKLGIDQAGNIILNGTFTGTVSIGGTSHTSEGYDDIFVASVSPAGVVNWSFALGGIEPDQPTAVTIGPSGDIYVAGRSLLAVDFDPGPGAMVLTGLGLWDGFFARYTPEGDLVWAKLLSTSGAEEIGFVEVDDDGMLYVGGTFRLELDFSLGAGGGTLSPVGTNGHFIAAYDTDGTFHWVRQFGGVGLSSLLHTALGDNWDGGTAIVVTGNFLDTLYLGTSSTYDALGPADAYTIVYDALGNILNSFTLGADGSYVFAGDVVVKGNELLYSGSTSGTIDLDPRAGSQSMFTASAEKDVFLIHYSNTLEPLDINTWEGDGEEYAFQLWQDAGANLLMGVRFTSSFYQAPGTTADLVSSNGGDDFSIIKLGDNTITIGLEETELPPFMIYPVPASTWFQVRLPDLLSDAHLTVYDARGRQVYAAVFASGESEMTVNARTWFSGIYVVVIRTTEGRATHKLVLSQ